MRMLKNALCAMVFCALAGCIKFGPPPRPIQGMVTTLPSATRSGTLPVLIDDNRMFVQLEFVRPDGSTRKALAFVNLGQATPTVSKALYDELGIGQGNPLQFHFGALPVKVAAASVQSADAARTLFAPLPVEAMLPAGVLQNFELVLDYGARTMTLAVPGTLKPEGVAVPLIRNDASGLVTMNMTVNAKPFKFVIDNGGSYSVFSAPTVETILADHPDFLRATSAIGEANNSIDNSGFDVDSHVLKLPRMEAGSLVLDNVGVTGSGMGSILGALVGPLFWNQYSDKAGFKVDGLLGGNALKNYRLTIDYAGRTAWWLRESPAETHDLDQIGITLGRDKRRYVVTGFAKKGRKPTVSGIATGDILVAVDRLQADSATRGEILSALHGTPGDRRHLILERDGRRIEVDASVTGF